MTCFLVGTRQRAPVSRPVLCRRRHMARVARVARWARVSWPRFTCLDLAGAASPRRVSRWPSRDASKGMRSHAFGILA